jgi:hypothetical protein
MLGTTAQGILLSSELRPYAIDEGAWLCKRAEADEVLLKDSAMTLVCNQYAYAIFVTWCTPEAPTVVVPTLVVRIAVEGRLGQSCC